MFDDNESVVLTATIPYSKLSKRHNALLYHHTREAIAAKIVRYYHIDGKNNPADILSKHWDMPSVWDLLKTLIIFNMKQDDGHEEHNDDHADTNINEPAPDQRGVKAV